MKRRTFLKLLAVGTTAAWIPMGPTLKAKTQFEPDREYGNAIRYEHAHASEYFEHAKALVIQQAKKVLPKGTRFQVRWISGVNYNRWDGVAWYHSPIFQGPEFKLGEHSPPRFEPSLGIHIVGGYEV